MGHPSHVTGDVQLQDAPHPATLQSPAAQPPAQPGCCSPDQPEPAASVVTCQQLLIKLVLKKRNHEPDGDLSSCVPHRSVESTALRLITALGSSEVQPQFTRFLNDPKTVLSAESEELNRALILTLARATHVTGSTRCGFTDLSDYYLKLFRNLLVFISVLFLNFSFYVQIFSQAPTPSMGPGAKTSSRP